MFTDLSTFVRVLEEQGELLRVRRPVSPVLEISAAAQLETRRRAPGPPGPGVEALDPLCWDRGGRALLFENVLGSQIPVLINTFGSYHRMELALGCHPQGHTPGGFRAIAERIGSLTRPVPPRTLGELWSKGREFLPLLRVFPKQVGGGSAPCQEVVETGEEVDLTRLPIPRCWPLDGDFGALGYPADLNEGVPGLGHPEIDADRWKAEFQGRYITFAGIHTIHYDDKGVEKPASHNIGMYRVQLMGRQRLAMHWHLHHDGARHWRSWRAAGEAMPVAIALGGESVLPYAATCPLPPGISELLMAGFLNQGGIPMVACKTVPLRVPANAEIVIEGYIRPDAGFPGWDPRLPNAGPLGGGAVFEGPFGDHTGYYSMPDRYPLVEVTAITRRKKAIFPATLVGLPPQEDHYMGKATERVMGALLKVIIHDIVDYDLPMFGTFHNCAALQVEKQYVLQGRRLMHSVWGAGQMAWTKCIFVVDVGENVHDPRAVLRAAARWCRPGRDIERVNGPLDILDHAAPRLGAGMKIGFDCTRKWPGEEVNGRAVEGANEAVAAAGPVEAAAHLLRIRQIPGVRDAWIQEEIPGWLLVEVDQGLGEPERAGLDHRVLCAVLELDPAADGCGPLPFVLTLGRGVDLRDPTAPFFHWLANSDASRDCEWRPEADRIGFACAPKTEGDARNGQKVRAWPPLVDFPPELLREMDLGD